MVAGVIKDAGGHAFAYQCDLTNKDEIERKATQVVEEVGKPTIVINNAGIVASKPFLDLTEREVRNVLEINTFSHFWVSCFSVFCFAMQSVLYLKCFVIFEK